MGRKRKTDYPIAGRPPVEPDRKVGTPVRALVTDPIADKLVEASQSHGIRLPRIGKIPSDIVRYYVYLGLTKDGLLSDTDRQDPTFDNLRALGLM